MLGRRFAWGFGTVCVAGVFAAYKASIPHIGEATRAEIIALVPPDLREPPTPNLAAQARLRQAVALSMRLGPDTPKRLTALLDLGPWQVPARETPQEEAHRHVGLERIGRVLVAEMRRVELLGCRANVRDRAHLGRTARLALRLIDAYDRAGGGSTDAEAIDEMIGDVCNGIVDAHDSAGLLRVDRLEIVRTIPPGGGRNTSMALAVARDFRLCILPRLVTAASGRKGLESALRGVSKHPLDMGTYDPLETTRLFVEFARANQFARRYGLVAVDSRLWTRAKRMIDALPTDPADSAGLWERVRYRWRVNHSANTLGRAWAVPTGIDHLGGNCEFRTYERNLLRATLQDPGRQGIGLVQS